MVTRAEVELAYQKFLGRMPESEAALEGWLHVPDIDTLSQTFCNSDEYKTLQNSAANLVRPPINPLDWPACFIESHVDAVTLESLINHVEESWTFLGETEPFYSVLTTPSFLKSSFDQNRTSFYESAQRDIDRLSAFAARAGVALPLNGMAFEFGCGVGRVTRLLGKVFARVIAADISASHLLLAEQMVTSNNASEHVSFRLLNKPAAIFEVRDYDFFFSVMVLQHNPPPVMAQILDAALQGLNMGGFAYFQVPTYRLGYAFRSKDYLDNLGPKGNMEMHVLPQKEVLSIIDRNRCKLLEVREDDYTGHEDGISNTFFLRKG